MPEVLQGLRILVPENRELDLFAAMLEGEDATVIRCPLVRIVALDDKTELNSWIDLLIDGAFDDVIVLTGEGLRHLLDSTETPERRVAMVAALGRVRIVTRGPKPVRVLREIGLAPGLSATAPTSQGVVDTLANENLRGRRIGVLLYPGDGTKAFLDALRARGADVAATTPYRYASQTDSDQVVNTIRSLASGGIDMVAFTSSPQVERLFEVAKQARLHDELHHGLTRAAIAVVGPVVEATLRAHGIEATVRPETSYHLKPLVRSIVGAWARFKH